MNFINILLKSYAKYSSHHFVNLKPSQYFNNWETKTIATKLTLILRFYFYAHVLRLGVKSSHEF